MVEKDRRGQPPALCAVRAAGIGAILISRQVFHASPEQVRTVVLLTLVFSSQFRVPKHWLFRRAGLQGH